jgi:hypothetical protein
MATKAYQQADVIHREATAAAGNLIYFDGRIAFNGHGHLAEPDHARSVLQIAARHIATALKALE